MSNEQSTDEQTTEEQGSEEVEESTKQEEEVEIPDGYISVDEVKSKYIPKDEAKTQEDIDAATKSNVLTGKRKALEELGADLDFVSKEDLQNKTAKEIIKEQEALSDLTEEKIAQIKQKAEEKAKKDLLPYKEKYEKLQERREEDNILSTARKFLSEEVVEGDWRDDFLNDVRKRTKRNDDGELIVVDEDGDPVPSDQKDKAVKDVTELIQELSSNKWKPFALDKPQTGDSGYSENGTTDRTGLTKKNVDRVKFISEHSYDEWANLPDE